MAYKITKEIHIRHTEDDWDFVFTTDEYGTVIVTDHNDTIHIPRDCVRHFIDALEQL